MQIKTLAVLIMASFGTVALPVAGAQAQQVAQQSATVSEEEIETFAMAYVETVEIQDEYIPQIESADNQDEQEALRQEATNLMIEAIENEGMSVERYNEIASQTREDETLATKINEKINEVQ